MAENNENPDHPDSAQSPQLTFFKPQISITTGTSFDRFIFSPPPYKKGKQKRVERLKTSKSWWGCRMQAGISGPGFWDCGYAQHPFSSSWCSSKVSFVIDLIIMEFMHTKPRNEPQLYSCGLSKWCSLLLKHEDQFLPSTVSVLFLTWCFPSFSRVLLPQEEDNDNIMP